MTSERTQIELEIFIRTENHLKLKVTEHQIKELKKNLEYAQHKLERFKKESEQLARDFRDLNTKKTTVHDLLLAMNKRNNYLVMPENR